MTSDRLLSVAVALRRQTLARDAIASGERPRRILLIRSSICGMRLFFMIFVAVLYSRGIFAALRCFSIKVSALMMAAEAAFPDLSARVRACLCRYGGGDGYGDGDGDGDGDDDGMNHNKVHQRCHLIHIQGCIRMEISKSVQADAFSSASENISGGCV